MKSACFGVLMLATVLLTGTTEAAQTCNPSITATTPTSRFFINIDGTVTDLLTGLMWKQCSEGQTWSNGTCTGTPSTSSWQSALTAAKNLSFAGYNDWRVPNVKELDSIVERQCSLSAINDTVFPLTPSAVFWTSTGINVSSTSTYALAVNFVGGVDANMLKTNSGLYVRLVRNGN